MLSAPPPHNETQRLARLQQFGVLDTLPQEAFDHITALASAICETPIALISLVDHGRQWFKSRVGLETQQTSRELAFCAHAILEPDRVMVVEDATRDTRFHDNPLVASSPDIRFYAGAPIVTKEGFALGTVCVIDRRSRTLGEAKCKALQSLAKLVLSLLEHQQEHHETMTRTALESARESEIQTALTAAGLDLLSFVDSDYVYRYVNRCYLEYWNKATEDIVGRRVSDLVGDTVFATVVKPYLDVALRGQEVSYEASISFPGRGTRSVEVTYLPVRNSAGKISGVVVRAHDIHALHLREDRLKATIEALEHKTLEQQRFIHIVSHDLKEPINTIGNFASLLSEDRNVQESTQTRRYLDFVLQGSQRIKMLLDDLVELLVLDRHVVNMTAVNMDDVVSFVHDDLQAALQQSGGLLNVGALPSVRGDATLLRILMQNLVSNALKFCPKDRTPIVTVEGRVQGEKAYLSVSDNGIGIPEDQADRIFDMFTRLNNKRDFVGSGLGLSICRRIADLHQGNIRVRSQLGEGSSFELELPLVQPETQLITET